MRALTVVLNFTLEQDIERGSESDAQGLYFQEMLG